MKKYVFIPAVFIKMSAIGGFSYVVLVFLKGDPYFYVGGFGLGLAVFSISMFVPGFSTTGESLEEK